MHGLRRHLRPESRDRTILSAIVAGEAPVRGITVCDDRSLRSRPKLQHDQPVRTRLETDADGVSSGRTDHGRRLPWVENEGQHGERPARIEADAVAEGLHAEPVASLFILKHYAQFEPRWRLTKAG